jgi:hypothetical protein
MLFHRNHSIRAMNNLLFTVFYSNMTLSTFNLYWLLMDVDRKEKGKATEAVMVKRASKSGSKQERRLDTLSKFLELGSSSCTAAHLAGNKLLISRNDFFFGTQKTKNAEEKEDKNQTVATIGLAFAMLQKIKDFKRLDRIIENQSLQDNFASIVSFTVNKDFSGGIILEKPKTQEIAKYVMQRWDKDYIRQSSSTAVVTTSMLPFKTDFSHDINEFLKAVKCTSKTDVPFYLYAFGRSYLLARYLRKISKYIIGNPTDPLTLALTGEEKEMSFGDPDQFKETGYTILRFDRAGVHAEVKIIEYLLFNARLSENLSHYIGISKLCCDKCDGFISVINGFYKTGGGEKLLRVSGTHHLKFPWEYPLVMLSLKDVEKALQDKSLTYDSYSELYAKDKVMQDGKEVSQESPLRKVLMDYKETQKKRVAPEQNDDENLVEEKIRQTEDSDHYSTPDPQSRGDDEGKSGMDVLENLKTFIASYSIALQSKVEAISQPSTEEVEGISEALSTLERTILDLKSGLQNTASSSKNSNLKYAEKELIKTLLPIIKLRKMRDMLVVMDALHSYVSLSEHTRDKLFCELRFDPVTMLLELGKVVVDGLYKKAHEALKLDETSLQKSSIRSGRKGGIVEYRAERDHLAEHAANVDCVITEIKEGKIAKGSIIAIERKRDGVNFGMPDVVALALLIQRNGTSSIRDTIKQLPLFSDAQLYNTAKQYGVLCVGVDTKGMAKQEHARDAHMHQRIEGLRNFCDRVIVIIGASHVRECIAK